MTRNTGSCERGNEPSDSVKSGNGLISESVSELAVCSQSGVYRALVSSWTPLFRLVSVLVTNSQFQYFHCCYLSVNLTTQCCVSERN
jgi:hypothetical protein